MCTQNKDCKTIGGKKMTRQPRTIRALELATQVLGTDLVSEIDLQIYSEENTLRTKDEVDTTWFPKQNLEDTPY